MGFDWKGLLKTVAPGIATAFGGPLAGVAVTALGNALGVSEPTQEKIQAALAGATPADMLKIKEAEEQFQKDMKALDIDLERINAADRDSARKMQVETKSLTPAVLATIITVGFFGILIGLMAGWLHIIDNPELLLLLGALAASWGQVVNFNFGSSSGSQSKDSTIKALSK